MQQENPIRRVILIVLDSVGIGALEDAATYGDEGANTLLHICETVANPSLPNLEQLGLGRIAALPGIEPVKATQGAYGKMAEQSKGKDTTTGHWELMGLVLDHPFSLFPNGFPDRMISAFQKKCDVPQILGNKAASGTAIIKKLGEMHCKTGYPIVYTSADSVFQIACHETYFGLDRLYACCEKARALLDEYGVSRVIARPFIGETADSFVRTENRRDYSMPPSAPTILDILQERGIPTIGIGKIADIFAGKGISTSYPSHSNQDALFDLSRVLHHHSHGLVFVNLVDFDMLYGHRRDPDGYYRALQQFDEDLNQIRSQMRSTDLLIITADHGCDPTFKGSDHTREYVPLLAYGEKVIPKNLGTRKSFSDVAQTIAMIFGVSGTGAGTSLFSQDSEGGLL